MTIEKLIKYGSITQEIADKLELLVRAKYNIFISGGTGSGKTTFLNALSNYIPKLMPLLRYQLLYIQNDLLKKPFFLQRLLVLKALFCLKNYFNRFTNGVDNIVSFVFNFYW